MIKKQIISAPANSQKRNIGFKIRKELKDLVGQDWNTIVQALKTKYPNEKQINSAEFLDVGISTILKGKKVFVRDQFGQQVSLESCSYSLYVDPLSKVLTENKFYTEKQRQRAAEKAKKLEEAAAYRKILSEDFIAIKQRDNNWAILKLAKFAQPEYDAYLQKKVNPAYDKSDLYDKYGIRDVFCEETRILTYQETRKLNLV